MEIAVSITVVRLELFDYHNCDSVSRRARLPCVQSTASEYEDCMWEGRHTLVLLVLVSIAVVATRSCFHCCCCYPISLLSGVCRKGSHSYKCCCSASNKHTRHFFHSDFHHPATGTSPSEIESVSKHCLAPD